MRYVSMGTTGTGGIRGTLRRDSDIPHPQVGELNVAFCLPYAIDFIDMEVGGVRQLDISSSRVYNEVKGTRVHVESQVYRAPR